MRERERETERRTVKLPNLQTEQHTVCEFVERERERESRALWGEECDGLGSKGLE